DLRHARDSGGQRDKGADNGQQARDEDGKESVACEEALGVVQVALVEQHESAIAVDERTASDGANPVGDNRAKIAADGSGDRDPDEREGSCEGRLVCVDQVAGEGHDDLRRQRDAGRLNGHEQRDSEISASGNGRDDEVENSRKKFVGHPREVYLCRERNAARALLGLGEEDWMELLLDAVEARVLGSLIEKEITTPEYYPLSVNALVNACNQKSSRDPVMQLDEIAVRQALSHLEELGLAGRMHDSRVLKFEHHA